MDIRNWPMDRIMQLPDCCFGRRFVISCDVNAFSDAYDFDISEVALPEKAVIWEVIIEPYDMTSAACWYKLVLGDYLPAAHTEVLTLEPLLHGYGRQGPSPRAINFRTTMGAVRMTMKMNVAAAGRRLVLQGYAPADQYTSVRVTVVVSGVPKEVPEWLCSGLGKNLL